MAAASAAAVLLSTYALQMGLIAGLSLWASLSTIGVGAVITGWGLVRYLRERNTLASPVLTGILVVFLGSVWATGFWLLLPPGLGTALVVAMIRARRNTPAV